MLISIYIRLYHWIHVSITPIASMFDPSLSPPIMCLPIMIFPLGIAITLVPMQPLQCTLPLWLGETQLCLTTSSHSKGTQPTCNKGVASTHNDSLVLTCRHDIEKRYNTRGPISNLDPYKCFPSNHYGSPHCAFTP